VDAAASSNEIKEIQQDKKGICSPPQRKKRRVIELLQEDFLGVPVLSTEVPLIDSVKNALRRLELLGRGGVEHEVLKMSSFDRYDCLMLIRWGIFSKYSNR
jgi:hypothetical protein